MKRFLIVGYLAVAISTTSFAADSQTGQTKIKEARDRSVNIASCEDVSSRITQVFYPLGQLVIRNSLKGFNPIPAHKELTDERLLEVYVPCNKTIDTWEENFTFLAYKDAALRPNSSPARLNNILATNIENMCEKGYFVSQLLGDKKVDSYDASAAIIGCRKFLRDQRSDVAYVLTIKGKRDVISMSRSIPFFDPAHPKKLPEMPMIKICEDKSSRNETLQECAKRNTR